MFGALEPSNFISQNTVINDKMTSIDQKIVYETLSTGIFFLLLPCVSEPEVSEQGSSLAQSQSAQGQKFSISSQMHLDFSYHNEEDFLPRVLAHSLPLYTELRSMGFLVA